MSLKAAGESLALLDRSAFGDDETGRIEALNNARAAVRRLEKPWERMYDMIWFDPLLIMAVKTSSDMGLFDAFSTTPQSSRQLSEVTGADSALIARLCRLLAAGHVVEETGPDAYRDADLSQSLKAPNGLINGIHHFFEVGVPQLAKTPDYFQETGFKNPSDVTHTPWQYSMGSPMWQWYKEHPEAGAHFQGMLSSVRFEQIPWPSAYPLSRLLDGFDISTALCVDVGGGKGIDMKHLAEAIPPTYAKAKVVVQDLPQVIRNVRTEDLPEQVELTSHNFFDEQPIKGARAYFMHSICHDWPDSEARKILTRLKEAGKPGYSRVLILEALMTERVKDMPHRMAAMDINMMLHFSALERTEKQWGALAESVGLLLVNVWQIKGHWQAIIEMKM